MNKVILMGRAGKDPVVKTLTGGKKVAEFSFATDDGKDTAGNKKTQWHNIVMWEKNAEFAEQWIKKGTGLVLEGRITYEESEKDGVKKYFTKIVVTNSHFTDKKEATTDGASTQEASAPAATAPKTAPATAARKPAATPAPAMATEEADDLPF